MNRLPGSYRSHALVLATTALVVAAAPAAAAGATNCGSMKPHGITALKATGTSCGTAADVARKHSYGEQARGWSCKGKRRSASVERVTCTRGARRVTFRSTLVMELPAAPAPPSAGSSR